MTSKQRERRTGRYPFVALAWMAVITLALCLGGCVSDHDPDYVSRILADTLGPEAQYAEAPEQPAGGELGGYVAEAPVTVPPAEAPAPVPAETPEAAPGETNVVVTPVPPAPPPVRQPGVVEIKPSIPTIQPDTVLWITVAEDPSLNGRYVVNNSSCIDFGYVGLVFLHGMTTEEAERTLKNVLEGRYLTKATLSVRIAKASYDLVGVRGYVESPGDIRIGPGTAITLAEALRRANGVRPIKDNLRVKIVRGGLLSPFGPAAEGEVLPMVTRDGRLKVPEVYLRNNDLAYVFAYESASASGGGKRILLLGEVPRRGVVDFAENEPCTLMYLLFKVGGLPRFAKASKIRIVRRDRLGRETTIIANGEALMKSGNPDDDVTLENGDRVIVPARTVTFF